MIPVIIWGLIGLFLFVVVTTAMRMFFRRLRGPVVDSRSFDFDLADLEKMVASGQMTQEEFLKARAVILSRDHANYQPVKGFPVLAPKDQPKEPPTSTSSAPPP
jgi:hypothetical protein